MIHGDLTSCARRLSSIHISNPRLNGIFGQHAGRRASHAKGTCAAGEFKPTGEAARLSKVPHFAGAAVPVTMP